MIRNKSFKDSINEVATKYPNIYMDLAKAELQENPALQNAAKRVALTKGANALNEAIKRGGGSQMVTPDDIAFDGGRGPAPQGPLRHKPLRGIPDLLNMMEKYSPEAVVAFDQGLDRFNRDYPEYVNVTRDMMKRA